MKQYNKLAECLVNDSLSHHQSWAEIKGGPFVLITIEELEQVFAAGGMYGAAKYHPEWEERPDFNTYLTSKGIKID